MGFVIVKYSKPKSNTHSDIFLILRTEKLDSNFILREKSQEGSQELPSSFMLFKYTIHIQTHSCFIKNKQLCTTLQFLAHLPTFKGTGSFNALHVRDNYFFNYKNYVLNVRQV